MKIVAADSKVPKGSDGTRPVKPSPGWVVLLDLIKPMAVSPNLSMAILPIHSEVLPATNVPFWNTDGVLFGVRISYQRMPEAAALVFTECVITNDSWVPKLRYGIRNISRSPKESSCWLVPPWGMQVRAGEHAGVNPATLIVVGPVNLELLGVTKSTWNLNR